MFCPGLFAVMSIFDCRYRLSLCDQNDCVWDREIKVATCWKQRPNSEPRSTKCLLKQSCGSGELQDRGREAALRDRESSPERISCPLAPRASFICNSSSKVFSMFLPLLSSHFLQKKHQKTKVATRRRKTTENRTIGKVSLYYWACLVAQW